MAVRAYAPVFPSIELFGAYEGIASATSVNEDVVLTFTPTSEGNLTVVPYGGDDNISQFQLEAASTPSSYIPTPEGSTATRAAETLTAPSANLPWPTPRVIGDELVTNGTFDTDLTGWTDGSIGTGTATWSSGTAQVTKVDGSNTGILRTTISTVSGNYYKLTGDLSGDNSKIAVGTAALDDSIASQVVSDGGSAELYFTAQGTTTHLYFLIDAASGTSAWDNISVTEVTPPAVSIQMGGRQTGDNSTMFRWYADANNYITQESGASDYTFEQADGGTVDSVTGGSFTSGILQPFNFASTHASTLVAAAVSGTALTDNTTPTALPDLQSTDVNLGHSFNGTIGVVRVWAGNITEAGREGASS